MKKNVLLTTTLRGLLLTLSFITAAGQALAGEPILRVGIVSDNPQGALAKLTPLTKHLGSQLSSQGIGEGQVVVTQDPASMAKKIKAGEVDLVLDSAYTMIKLHELAGAELSSLLFWRKGVRSYHTLFFVHRDSTIQSLADLKGKTIAFEDSYSTSAFVLPRAELAQQGLAVTPRAQAGANSVGYVLAGQELNQAFLVAEKRIDAGAFNNNDWDKLPPKLQAELRVIHRTRPILRWLACFSPHTPARLRQAVEAALLEMEGDPKGREALSADHIKHVERMTIADRESLDYIRHIVANSER